MTVVLRWWLMERDPVYASLRNLWDWKLEGRHFHLELRNGNMKLLVPAKEWLLGRNEEAIEYYKYVVSEILSSRDDLAVKVAMLQSWPSSYKPGEAFPAMYDRLRAFVLSRATDSLELFFVDEEWKNGYVVTVNLTGKRAYVAKYDLTRSGRKE